jgi:uncharacterized protein YciI
MRTAMVTDGPTATEQEVIGRHFDYLQAACVAGTVLLFGRTTNNDADVMGLCVFRASAEDDARAFMAADPCVQHGVMTARLFPYRIAGHNPAAATL